MGISTSSSRISGSSSSPRALAAALAVAVAVATAALAVELLLLASRPWPCWPCCWPRPPSPCGLPASPSPWRSRAGLPCSSPLRCWSAPWRVALAVLAALALLGGLLRVVAGALGALAAAATAVAAAALARLLGGRLALALCGLRGAGALARRGRELLAHGGACRLAGVGVGRDEVDPCSPGVHVLRGRGRGAGGAAGLPALSCGLLRRRCGVGRGIRRRVGRLGGRRLGRRLGRLGRRGFGSGSLDGRLDGHVGRRRVLDGGLGRGRLAHHGRVDDGVGAARVGHRGVDGRVAVLVGGDQLHEFSLSALRSARDAEGGGELLELGHLQGAEAGAIRHAHVGVVGCVGHWVCSFPLVARVADPGELIAGTSDVGARRRRHARERKQWIAGNCTMRPGTRELCVACRVRVNPNTERNPSPTHDAPGGERMPRGRTPRRVSARRRRPSRP